MVIALSGRYEADFELRHCDGFLFFGLTATTIFVFRRRAARGEMNASEVIVCPGIR